MIGGHHHPEGSPPSTCGDGEMGGTRNTSRVYKYIQNHNSLFYMYILYRYDETVIGLPKPTIVLVVRVYTQ